jgi:cyclophilin family peptidyl-prolyl cis-trans isomerase
VRAVLFLAAVLAASAVFVACGGGSSAEPTATSRPAQPGATAAPTEVAAAPGTCGPAGSAIAAIPRNNARRFAARPALLIDAAKKYTARMVTARGTIVIELAAAEAPNTVNNFVILACHGFYDGLTFHRVASDPPVIQGGDPNGDGTGGPGYVFDQEISPSLRHVAGTVSMARTQNPNSNGSQFFIMTGTASHLDGQYNAFGRVTAGMDVVRAIRRGDKILSVSIEEQ